ncbi:MAG: hypothetical protein Q6365_022205, partial [Candidatus Sigynarchaeota archaeon]
PATGIRRATHVGTAARCAACGRVVNNENDRFCSTCTSNDDLPYGLVPVEYGATSTLRSAGTNVAVWGPVDGNGNDGWIWIVETFRVLGTYRFYTSPWLAQHPRFAAKHVLVPGRPVPGAIVDGVNST